MMKYDMTPLMHSGTDDMKQLVQVNVEQDDVTVTYAHDIRKLLRIKFDNNFTIANLPELMPHDIIIVCHSQGLKNGLDYNQNFYPFFYVGQCYLVDKHFAGLSDTQIDFINEWLEGLKRYR